MRVNCVSPFAADDRKIKGVFALAVFNDDLKYGCQNFKGK
jgi:hypothetical protein